MRILKLNKYNLQLLERELDRIADKHGIEEPLRFMPTLDDMNDEEEDDERG
jgi:hypothetical protein